MKYSSILEVFGFFLLLGYVAFIPSGPYPIFILGVLKLDVIFGVLLAAFCAVHVGKLSSYPKAFIAAWALYFFLVFVSAALSENLQYSVRYALIMFGYSLVAIVVPVVFMKRAETIRLWMFLVACIIAVLIIYMYVFLDFAQTHRFALGFSDLSKHAARLSGVATVDPNMTAAGLMLALIGYFPNMFERRKRLLLDLTGLLCVLSACLITLSRSAILGFVLAVLASGTIVLLTRLKKKGIFVFDKKALKFFFLFLLMVPAGILIVGLFFPDVIDKQIRRMAGISQDTARIGLFIAAWDVFVADVKTVLIGAGFMTTNPHNEYMRTLSTMGVVGVVVSAIFLTYMFFIAVKATFQNHRNLFSALSIIFFVMAIALFYGYTKLIWVAWMFLLLLYTESRSAALVRFYASPLSGFGFLPSTR